MTIPLNSVNALLESKALIIILSVALYLAAAVAILLIAGVTFGPVSYPNPTSEGKALILSTAMLLIAVASGLLWRSEKPKHNPSVNKRPDPNLTENDYDEVFKLSQSIRFYDLIAPYYDQRTSPQRERTNDLIHSFCQSQFFELKGKSIADLGGGTGSLLRKFRHHDVKWVNVDQSRTALKIFNSTYRTNTSASYRTFDICAGSYAGAGEKFDIIILGFVLSSIHGPFPFNNILSMMHEDSILIVADNVPEYSSKRLYGFKDIDGKSYALRIRPIDPLMLQTEARNAGLRRVDLQFVYTEDDTVYSQVQSFRIASK